MMDESPRLPFCPRSFDPTAEELIAHFLRNHILQQSYKESGTIQEYTVYGEDINPWDKFCDPHDPYPWEGTTLFLFTQLSDVGITDKSCSVQKNRKSGRGTWHGTSKLMEVTSSSDESVVIGHCRALSFRSLDGKETKGQWTMYEYGISDDAFPEIRSVRGWNNHVVCRIKRDDSKASVGGKVTTRKGKSSPKTKRCSLKPVPMKRKASPKALPNKRRK